MLLSPPLWGQMGGASFPQSLLWRLGNPPHWLVSQSDIHFVGICYLCCAPGTGEMGGGPYLEDRVHVPRRAGDVGITVCWDWRRLGNKKAPIWEDCLEMPTLEGASRFPKIL